MKNMNEQDVNSKCVNYESPDTDNSKSERKSLLNDEAKGDHHKEWRYNKETILGLLLAFLSVLMTALSKICVQALESEVPHFFLNTLRSSTATAGMTLVFLCTCCLPRVDNNDLKPTILYSVSGTLYGLSIYISVVYIPLVSAEACFTTTAILSSLIVFGLFEKEDIRIDQVSKYTSCITGGYINIFGNFDLLPSHNNEML